jgi:hypothetical protein
VVLVRTLHQNLFHREMPLGLSFFFTCDDGTDELGSLSDLYRVEALSHDAQRRVRVEAVVEALPPPKPKSAHQLEVGQKKYDLLTLREVRSGAQRSVPFGWVEPRAKAPFPKAQA